MFCPNCGAESERRNAYCKRCGEWLPDLKSSRAKWGGETPQQHLTAMLFLSGFSALAALSSAIVLYVTHLGGGADMTWPVALTAALCVSISAWQVSNFFIGLKLRRRLGRGRGEMTSQTVSGEGQPQPEMLGAADNSQLSAPRRVTEKTTDLLTPLPNRLTDRKS